jgi:PTH1 family peptidyl-tRNA hydrolase
MKLIVGLGNPGSQYVHTRHNIGFTVVDQLAKNLDLTWKAEPKLKSEIASLELDGQKVLLAKPQTFMNLSGEAVQRLMQFYKAPTTDVWVISDDVDVPFGRLRIRRGGTSGQQGLRSITEHIGDQFYRFRMGISLNDRAKESSEQYVLRPFNPAERDHLPQVIESCATVIQRQLSLPAPEETTFYLV